MLSLYIGNDTKCVCAIWMSVCMRVCACVWEECVRVVTSSVSVSAHTSDKLMWMSQVLYVREQVTGKVK